MAKVHFFREEQKKKILDTFLRYDYHKLLFIFIQRTKLPIIITRIVLLLGINSQ